MVCGFHQQVFDIVSLAESVWLHLEEGCRNGGSRSPQAKATSERGAVAHTHFLSLYDTTHVQSPFFTVVALMSPGEIDRAGISPSPLPRKILKPSSDLTRSPGWRRSQVSAFQSCDLSAHTGRTSRRASQVSGSRFYHRQREPCGLETVVE